MNKDNVKIIKIGVDGNEANLASRVGVNTYAYETLRAISDLESEWSGEVCFEILLKEQPLPHMPKETPNFCYKILPGTSLWILKILTPYLLVNFRKYDVFWSLSHYVPPISFTKQVCSIMDLGYLTSKSQFTINDYWQLKLWTMLSLFVSRKIIAISNATKKDIENRYSFTRGKVVATLLGYDASRYNENVQKEKIREVCEKYGIPDKYILFLGTLKPSKNIGGLLQAWSQICKNYPKISLVVAGKKGWLFENIFEIVKKLSLEKQVVFTDFFEEEEKPALIAGAKLFVLPSFWEGFGLDVLSAMACGVPVVVSDKGSLPEVAGDAGIITDPKSPDEIAKALTKILSVRKKEYEGYTERGLLQVKKFSWHKTARETLMVLKETALGK